jgi:glycosyltransferase involved in cell wall biosynthesis
MRRVLFLIHDLRRGGAERVFVTLVRGMERVEAVPVLVRRYVELDEARGSLTLLDLDGPVVRLVGSLPWLTGGPAVALLWKAWRLHRLARRLDARIISTFLHKSHAIALCARLIFQRRLRIVVNVHELPSQHLPHHFTPAAQRVMRWFYRRMLPRADCIIAVAEGVKRDLVTTFGIPAERIVVLANPLDIAEIRAGGEAGATDVLDGIDGRVVVAVGRLVKLKGYDHLLRAWALLRPARGDTLVIVGDGEERQLLECLAHSLGIAASVRFAGAQSNPWRILGRAQVLALPSLTEAFPNVLGEAMALGVPIVASRCSPGVEAYLDDGRCGILVPPADPGALADGLRRLLDDPALQAEMAGRGLRRVEGFAAGAVLPRYELLLAGDTAASRDPASGVAQRRHFSRR